MGLATGIVILLLLHAFAQQDTTLNIYDGKDGKLQNGWENWSWATVNYTDTTVVRPGKTYSLSVVMNNWEALYLHGSFNAVYSQLKVLHFWINGGTNGSEPILIKIISGGNLVGQAVDITSVIGGPLPKNTWVEANLLFTMFGNVDPNMLLDGLWFEANTGSLSGTIYLDDIWVTEGPPPPPVPPADQFSVIDVTTNVRDISPLIFGVNFASKAQLTANKYTTNRWGGNAVTRYAYDQDASNHASDWYFEDIANDNADPSKLPFNSSSDNFIQDTFGAGAQVQLTIPLIGWTPFDRTRRCGFSVTKYGTQQDIDPNFTDCGNGKDKNGNNIVNNDPTDTSRAITNSYVLDWITHLEQAFGSNLSQKLVLLLDNEPGIWHATHRDVHPNPLTYDELWNRTLDYAGAVKTKFPNYKTLGPVFWGWCAYMFSSQDGCQDGPDRQAHGDLPQLEWYIKQVGDYRSKNGVTLVDIIDVHFYPQEPNVPFSDAEDPATAAFRLASVKSLYNRSYVDQSWIGQPIYIIPRMQDYIEYHAPGLKSSLSEYNFGGDDIITGALAQVEALAIFAREGLYSAARWGVPNTGTLTESAFAVFLNYDGKGANLLSAKSVAGTTTNMDVLGSYGFADTQYVYALLVFKATMAGNVTVDFTSATTGSGTATLYRFEKGKPLYAAGTASLAGGRLLLNVPAWSATLVRVARGTNMHPHPPQEHHQASGFPFKQ